ncbi:hypothetical protein AB4427_07485 [Vibrio artabrorum]|uniref:hypothetical protein n=1 Tax=Vibrio artabrorum TaxID=446374 RepID=UPI003552C229
MKTQKKKESVEQLARRGAVRRQIELREELKAAGLALEDGLYVVGNKDIQHCLSHR